MPGSIVGPDWIREHLEDPDVVFVHVGGDRAEYDGGHLPGAIWADGYGDFTEERGGIRALVPSTEGMEATLSRLGIAPSQTVVCVASGKSMWPSRAFWVLRYFRWPDVRLADRSVAALASDGLPATTEAATREPVTCRLLEDGAEPDASILSTAEDVLAASQGEEQAVVLDCRTAAEFRGEPGGHPAPREGRVPRAQHLNWELLVDDDGRFLPSDRLRSLFLAAGVDGSKPVYPYCGGGIRAAASWYAMYEILGWDGARNYDGSWAEWSRREELPVETG